MVPKLRIVLLALLIAAMYALCLRFGFPGYLGPLAPFHGDFYDYTGMAEVSWARAAHYPRPVTFLLFKLFGAMGVKGLMAAGIAVALLDVLLVLSYATRITPVTKHLNWVAAILYLDLVFIHPRFYIEHRHDMPAMFSLLFGMLALHCWLSWLKNSSVGALLVCPVCVLAFAFSKEAFFVSIFALIAPLLALYGRRWQTIGFSLFCGVAEVSAILYSRSLASPFVDPSATAAASYHIDAHPGSVLRVFAIYGMALFSFSMVVFIALGMAQAVSARRNRLVMTAYIAAGLGALLPISLLPNHIFREYAWLAVPFVLIPVALLEVPEMVSAQRRVAVIFVVSLLLNFYGDHTRGVFRATEMRWYLEQEQIGRNLLASLHTAAPEVARARRIVVAGLENPFVPWASDTYTTWRFGNDRFWSVVTPRDKPDWKSSRNVAFLPASKIDLAQADLFLIYRPDGSLDEMPPGDNARSLIHSAADLIPELRGIKPASEIGSRTELAVDRVRFERWSLFAEARPYFERGIELGDPEAAYGLQQMNALAAKMEARTIPATMVIVPATTVTPDHSGLAVVRIEWRVADGTPVELHVESCNGPLLANAAGSGSAETGKWVRDQMKFYLQDVSGGKALSAANTLATATASVKIER